MKTKNELIEEVLRLDGERTQGDWEHGEYSCPQDSDTHYVTDGESDPIRCTNKRDAAFIALSSRMPNLIRDLISQRDMAVEALETMTAICEGYNGYNGIGVQDSRKTLAKIKSGEWLETTVQHNTKYEG